MINPVNPIHRRKPFWFVILGDVITRRRLRKVRDISVSVNKNASVNNKDGTLPEELIERKWTQDTKTSNSKYCSVLLIV